MPTTTVTAREYAIMVKEAAPSSKTYKTLPLAFLIGGGICALGEGFINLYISLGVPEDTAYPAASITLIFIAALLTALNVFDKIARVAGAGTLVPITGFANAVASPALEFKSEGYIMGLGGKIFTIAGPVLVYGLAAGVLYGLIIYLFKLY